MLDDIKRLRKLTQAGSPGLFQEEVNILAHAFLKLCAPVGLA